jgi:hypothetical protein
MVLCSLGRVRYVLNQANATSINEVHHRATSRRRWPTDLILPMHETAVEGVLRQTQPCSSIWRARLLGWTGFECK